MRCGEGCAPPHWGSAAVPQEKIDRRWPRCNFSILPTIVTDKYHFSSENKGAPGAERECGNYLRHEMYKNSVSSFEAGMGMEGQSVCIEQ